ncbi:type I-E CRISPR-associated protein Cse2/CasB, partial [Gardnerella swidsinskii]|nr:type I-E CRISPR-associated protein Cse2/CasB [Gardnerella swidsinskii]
MAENQSKSVEVSNAVSKIINQFLNGSNIASRR